MIHLNTEYFGVLNIKGIGNLIPMPYVFVAVKLFYQTVFDIAGKITHEGRTYRLKIPVENEGTSLR